MMACQVVPGAVHCCAMNTAHGRRGEELPLLSSMEISGEASASADTIRIGNKNEEEQQTHASTHPLKRPPPAGTTATSSSEDHSAHSEPHHGTGTVLETALNSAKTCLGTGTLALPYAASQGGYLFNVLGLILISLWNLFNVNRLIHCEELVRELYGDWSQHHQQNCQGRRARHESRTSRHRRTGSSMRKLFRGMLTDANINDNEVQWSEENVLAEQNCPPEGTSTYGRVAWYAIGPIGLHIMDASLLVLLCGVVIAYQDAIMSFVRETPVTTGSTALDSLATVLIIAPLTCVEDLHFLSKTSALGIVIIFISFGVIFAYGLIQHGLSGIWDVTWDDMWPNSLTGACNWFGVTVFGFGAVPITFNLMESMRNPRGMSEATKIALWIVGCTYLTVGNGIGILFKPSVPEFKGDVLQELPETLWIPTMIRIAMSLVLTFTAPILLVPCAEIIEGKLGMIDLEHKPHYRILIRFGICFFCASVALIVPSFVHIISFIGAFCVVLTSFVFPPLLHLQLLRKKMSETEGIRLFKRSDKELGRFGTIQDKNKQFWRRTAHIDAALLLLGIILSLLASAVTFIDLMRQIRLYREDDDGDGE